MAEGLVLTDPENVERHRTALIEDLPAIFEAAGAGDQADLLRSGRHEGFVTWNNENVSTKLHGFTQGKFGVAASRQHLLNPLAQAHGLIGPVRLWQPGDTLPEGKRPGDIADYQILGNPDALPMAVLQSNKFVGYGATFDGMLGRIDSVLQAAARAVPERGQDELPEVVMLTGMRRTEEREGKSGLYKQLARPDADPAAPITDLYLTEADSAIAIFQSRCQSFELVEEVGDPRKDHKPANRIHPVLGGRTWIARRYAAQLTDDRGGRHIIVAVVNGEPIQAPERLNASKKDPAPLAVETLKDWLGTVESPQPLSVALGITFAHLARIGARQVAESNKFVNSSTKPVATLGRVSLLGSMPQQVSWERTEIDEQTGKVVYNGGSLVLGEVLPTIKSYNTLTGRPAYDLGR